MARGLAEIHAAYVAVKERCLEDCGSARSGNAVWELAQTSLRFLQSKCRRVPLVSKVTGKQYFSYRRSGSKTPISRPANLDLFCGDAQHVGNTWEEWQQGGLQGQAPLNMLYTVALAPCLAMELFDRQNKKGPATYFECLIGHLFAKALGVNPHKRASLKVCGEKVALTMDFLFEKNAVVRVHLPVKMSTRERVVQAWSHQRILDAAFGEGAYRGIMVLFSETKLDWRSHEVVEICVPSQWLVYQVHLSRIHRIYYFDTPARYEALTEKYPHVIQIKNVCDFFSEKGAILAS